MLRGEAPLGPVGWQWGKAICAGGGGGTPIIWPRLTLLPTLIALLRERGKLVLKQKPKHQKDAF